MSTVDEDVTYNDLVERLDHDYIREIAEQIREEIADGDVVGFSYQPGNHTAYDLMITPIGMIHQLTPIICSPGSWRVPQGLGPNPSGWFVVSKLNGMTWTCPVELTGPFHWSYLTSKTSGIPADGAALTALFRAIAQKPILDPS